MGKSKRIKADEVVTIGRMRETLDVNLHRIEYILATRRHIVPVGKAGRYRLYNASAVQLVQLELDEQDRRRRCRLATTGGAVA